jgi:hypothetical protein
MRYAMREKEYKIRNTKYARQYLHHEHVASYATAHTRAVCALNFRLPATEMPAAELVAELSTEFAAELVTEPACRLAWLLVGVAEPTFLTTRPNQSLYSQLTFPLSALHRAFRRKCQQSPEISIQLGDLARQHSPL